LQLFISGMNMLTENELKKELEALAEKKFKPSDNKTAEKLVPAMLTHIGSPDPELRDSLIYSAFASWVMRYDVLSIETLRNTFKTLLDDKHLLFGFGETKTDSIFTRSFSALWLPPILIKHRQSAFLSSKDILDAHRKLTKFLREEKDRRGFVEGKGWAHAAAHAGDALDDLAQCPEIGAEELRKMLPVIRETMSMTEFVYAHGEDERMVTPVLAVIQRDLLPSDEIKIWLESFVAPVKETKTMPDGVILRANIQNFLQSLYFRLKWADANSALLPAIENTLREINIFA